jgi:hypothetical protein
MLSTTAVLLMYNQYINVGPDGHGAHVELVLIDMLEYFIFNIYGFGASHIDKYESA